MRAGTGEEGYILILLLFLILGLPLMILFSVNAVSDVKAASSRMQSDLTMMRMGLIKTSIIRQSRDVDGDGYQETIKNESGSGAVFVFEPSVLPPTVDEGGGLSSAIKLATKDAWDQDILYCHWDLGSANSIDPSYSQNQLYDPPIDGLVARLISAGPDGRIQTGCNDPSAVGDDIVENIYNSDIRTYYR